MTEPTPETTTPEEQERAELFAWFDENRSLCQAAIAAVRQHEPPAADVDDSTTVYYAIRVPLQTRTDRQFLERLGRSEPRSHQKLADRAKARRQYRLAKKHRR